MDCRKLDGDLSQCPSPLWKMRDVSFPIHVFQFILLNWCFAYALSSWAWPHRLSRAWALDRSFTRLKSSSIVTDLRPHLRDSITLVSLASYVPCTAPCGALILKMQRAWLRLICVRLSLLFLIWSFALSVCTYCIVLDLLIAASEMLLLLFHMSTYGTERRRRRRYRERPSHCHGSKIKDCLCDDEVAVKANGRMKILGAALPCLRLWGNVCVCVCDRSMGRCVILCGFTPCSNPICTERMVNFRADWLIMAYFIAIKLC